MSEERAAWFRVPASAAGAVMKAPGLRAEQKNQERDTMKAYQIITAGKIVAIVFALDITDALLTAVAQGITADNAIRIDY